MGATFTSDIVPCSQDDTSNPDRTSGGQGNPQARTQRRTSIRREATRSKDSDAPPPMLKKRSTIRTKAFAKLDCKHGLECHDNVRGGVLTGCHVAHLNQGSFKGGMHSPKFNYEEGLNRKYSSGSREFETALHYLVHCAELGCKREDGKYGGPLCHDPFGYDVRGYVDDLTRLANDDTSFAYNNFKYPAPKLSKEQAALCRDFDYADKTAKLPCGPLTWPAGFPEPGYIPDENHLTGHWIAVKGGQKEYIKNALAASRGRLSKEAAAKIVAESDGHKTGGMYLRINQYGDVVTFDASVEKFARAKRTWKSGHYMWEPLVSGKHLMGAWVVEGEKRIIGFFYEMGSGLCFRIERRVINRGPYIFLRQTNEFMGKKSFVFFVKVDHEPGSAPLPVASRDYTALAGRSNVPTNLGRPYPVVGIDLDAPKKRDVYVDEVPLAESSECRMMRRQSAYIGQQTQRPVCAEREHIGMGYISDPIIGVSADALWQAALYLVVQNPQEFMDVSNVVVKERGASSKFLWRTMFDNVSKRQLAEHVFLHPRRGEIVFRNLDPRTRREYEEERIVTIRDDAGSVRVEFVQRHTTDGTRSYWRNSVASLEGLISELTELAKHREGTAGSEVGLGLHSAPITGVSHDALWKAMIEAVRKPQKYVAEVRLIEVEDNKGYLKRTTLWGDETEPVTERILMHEASCEIVSIVVDKFGNLSEHEHVVALRSHPMAVEFFNRNRKDGFRVPSYNSRSTMLCLVDAFVREARRNDVPNPEFIGYGATSEPVSDCSYEALFMALNLTIMDPGLVEDIDPSCTKVQEFNGFVLRSYRTNGQAGDIITEKVTVYKEIGEVVYCRQTSDGRDGVIQRVVAIHTGPLRVEIYERNAGDDVRVCWKAPYKVATKLFGRVVQLARRIEGKNKVAADQIGYGISSAPMTGIGADALWKAMLYSVRNPSTQCDDSAGDNDVVLIVDRGDFLSRTMTLECDDAPRKDHIYIDEEAKMITYRPVVDGLVSQEEHVFRLRYEPLRCEMFKRDHVDGQRIHWKAPKAEALEVFKRIVWLGRIGGEPTKTCKARRETATAREEYQPRVAGGVAGDYTLELPRCLTGADAGADAGAKTVREKTVTLAEFFATNGMADDGYLPLMRAAGISTVEELQRRTINRGCLHELGVLSRHSATLYCALRNMNGGLKTASLEARYNEPWTGGNDEHDSKNAATESGVRTGANAFVSPKGGSVVNKYRAVIPEGVTQFEESDGADL